MKYLLLVALALFPAPLMAKKAPKKPATLEQCASAATTEEGRLACLEQHKKGISFEECKTFTFPMSANGADQVWRICSGEMILTPQQCGGVFRADDDRLACIKQHKEEITFDQCRLATTYLSNVSAKELWRFCAQEITFTPAQCNKVFSNDDDARAACLGGRSTNLHPQARTANFCHRNTFDTASFDKCMSGNF